ncbi:hypothetical protein [Jannaschia marina]|uniref:hypothetical protein n=1 Tax=Jannaschia marina TaxID=2741674 RepID=UPI0015C6C31A|nr:hypothetical protein [Jannaschia marina]
MRPTHDHALQTNRPELAAVAGRALSQVALTRSAATRAAQVERLYRAVLSPDMEAWRGAGVTLLGAGVPVFALIDDLIPAVAARLGDDWVSDAARFADVTLGCARLTQLLGWAETRISAADLGPPLAIGPIYLIRPAGAQHLLGQRVLASRLGRMGVVARALSDTAGAGDAAGVLISASGCESVGDLRATVARARSLGPAPFVAIGGGAVTLAPETCTAAGADRVTCDLSAVIDGCLSRDRALA